MENGYGGAKPKRKSLRSLEDDKKRSHVCSKEKHKHKNTYAKSKQQSNDKTENFAMQNGSNDNSGNLANDCEDFYETAHCNNDTVLLKESRKGFRQGKVQDQIDIDLPLFMPYSNLSEADVFDDVDFKRKEVDIDCVDDCESVLAEPLDISNCKITEIKGHAEELVEGRNKPRRKHQLNVHLNQAASKSVKNLKKNNEIKTGDIIIRHEESLREKWKRSGLALRKFLSERLGFNSAVKQEKKGSLQAQNCEEEFTSISKSKERLAKCDSEKHSDETMDGNERAKIVEETKPNKDREIKLENIRRRDSTSPEPGSAKSSRSMISKLKSSFKSKKKKRKDSFVKLSDDSYPSSPLSHSSSSNGSCFINNSISLDTSQDLDVPFSDHINDGLNENDLIARLNLNSDTGYTCDCQMCKTHKQYKSYSLKQRKLCESKKSHLSKDKSKKLSKKSKVKKKGYVGVLDHEVSSTDDDLFKEEEVTLKRRHKDYARERLSSNSQDTVTPENTPPRSFISDDTTTVLSGLHYAIPYLPPRLRNRLDITNEDRMERRDEVHQNNAQSSKELGSKNKCSKSKCSKLKSSSKSKQKHSKTSNAVHDNFVGDLLLDDFGDLDKDWDSIDVDPGRNPPLLSSPQQRSSRTNGEIYDGSIFARFRPEFSFFNNTYSDDLIESLDRPFVSHGEELSVEGSNSTDTAKGGNSLYDLEDESLLEDLVNKMDRIYTDEEEEKGGQENGSFFSEAASESNKPIHEAVDRSEEISWGPLPVSESCDEADDEFECDCEHCSLLRQRNTSSDLNDLTDLHDLDAESEALRQQRLDEMRFGAENELLIPDPYVDDDLFNITGLELTSLDFMLMAESTFRLDIMLENVIQQMLAVQPDLLNDQVIPPASQSTIDNLPTVTLNQEHIEQSPACPICLCPCELEEVMTSLVCSHLFHPLCIQAWLAKSGTCPVCRSAV